ncbi:MAG: hypothetical protein Phog2KO_20950 [Phototrophicaceae bacterium]
MTLEQKFTLFEKKATLSTLWIFVLLNVIFRDIHELFRVGLLEEMITGVVNGTEITNSLMLIAGIGLEISILMVILARVLPYRVNRWANIIISLITMLSLVSAGTNDMDDIFFLAVELMALVYIIYYAWTWHQGKVTHSLAH